MSQVKLFESKSFSEIEEQINVWAYKHQNGKKIIITRTETMYRTDVDKYQTLVSYELN